MDILAAQFGTDIFMPIAVFFCPLQILIRSFYAWRDGAQLGLCIVQLFFPVVILDLLFF